MSLTLVAYAEVARSLAIYPKDRAYEYPSLGRGGEIGELCAKIDFFTQQQPLGENLSSQLKGMTKEVGDVLWYVANTAYDAGIKIEELVPECCAGMGEVTFAAIQQTMPPVRPLVLAGLAGKACELAKKYLRDDNSEMTDDRRWKVHNTLIEILLALGGVCNTLGISFDEAAQGNLDKLLDRQKRGVLQGSGDNR